SGWSDLTGATASNLTLTQNEAEKYIRVLARYTDGQNTPESVASLAITANVTSNVAPTASSGAFTTPEDTPYSGTLIGFDGNADPLTFAVLTLPAHGAISLSQGNSGTFLYTPETNYFGSDSFTFQVNDGTLNSNIASMTITVTPVNDPPTGAVTIQGSAIQGETLSASNTLADTEGLGAIGYQWQSSANGVNGWINIAGATSDSFTITQSQVGRYLRAVAIYVDGQNTPESVPSAPTTLTANRNDPPMAQSGAFVTPEDTPYAGLLPTSDPDGDRLTHAIVNSPAKGTLTITDETTGAFTYTPYPDINGPDTFTYLVNDGVHNSVVATMAITITPVNDPPTASNLTITLPEDTVYSGKLPAKDVDGDPISFSITSFPQLGTVKLTDATTGAFTYTPNPNLNGSDSFTFMATDGTEVSNLATVSITIQPVNDPPTASSGTFTTNEDKVYNGFLPVTDVDATPLTYTLITLPTKGSISIINTTTGAFTYTPYANAFGTDSFTIKASDGAYSTDPVTIGITIQPVNDPPVAPGLTLTTPENTPISGKLAATDADGDTVIYTLVANGNKGVATLTDPATGAFTYTPNPQMSGADNFTYKVQDGKSDSNVGTVTITIQPHVNAKPIVTPIAHQSVQAGTPSITIPFTVSDAETPTKDLLFSAKSLNNALIRDEEIQVIIEPLPMLVINPTTTQTGSAMIVLSVSDGADTTTTYFTLSLLVSSGTSTQITGLDVDQNGISDATDGVLILRRLNGSPSVDTGIQLPAGQTNRTIIKTIDALSSTLDMDGNGITNATDGVLILRHLVGAPNVDTGILLPSGQSNASVLAAIDARLGETRTITEPPLEDFSNALGMSFKPIPMGKFTMGSATNETGRSVNEGSQHAVTLTRSFYLQSTEVTQGQWKTVMGSNPAHFSKCGDTCPVEQVSWDDIQLFLAKMNARGEGTYRLPTEAEWEYAARAGSSTAYFFGDDATRLGDYAWDTDNALAKTHPVGDKLPNPYGLYDMTGNV
ncbi:MAG: tandem-95 repeat protein, partial [Magnetococcales bacterium]|nr:tandem-95 repeat protein [Magnetococcales bacterium]